MLCGRGETGVEDIDNRVEDMDNRVEDMDYRGEDKDNREEDMDSGYWGRGHGNPGYRVSILG